jgi:3-isopropylmalate/(R)-2-methylmalate dehydratase small subunit
VTAPRPILSSHTGRAWVIGDDIDTDVIHPMAAVLGGPMVERQVVLSSIRPGWASTVADGDILVTGRRFGIGSARPAGLALARLGIAVIVSESMSSTFLRNCVNYGIWAFTCDDVREAVTEGDRLCVDVRTAEVQNLTTGARLVGRPLPHALQRIIDAGGIEAQLVADGLIEERR